MPELHVAPQLQLGDKRRSRYTVDYMWWCLFLSPYDAGGNGTFLLLGRISVVPWMCVKGAVAANVGKLWARASVAASKPEASLINVGSLNAVPKKLIPRGTPYWVQLVGCVGKAQS